MWRSIGALTRFSILVAVPVDGSFDSRDTRTAKGGGSVTPPAAVSIRPATAKDASAVTKCLQLAFESHRGGYTPDAYRETTLTPDLYRERLASMTILVAVADKNLVVGTLAFQVIAEGEGHLRGMAVLPAWQGTGVADELLAAAERKLRGGGCLHVSLDTTEPLTRAVRFYEKHGYRSTGRVTSFFGMAVFEYAKPLT